MRTVQRRVRHLMDVAKVETRMQLGFHAARRGWLDTEVTHDRPAGAGDAGVDDVRSG
jgi:hypothetical protein